MLKRSRVRLYGETLEEREFTLAVIEGGTIFGEESLTSRRSRNAYAECMEGSEVAVLSAPTWSPCSGRPPRFGCGSRVSSPSA